MKQNTLNFLAFTNFERVSSVIKSVLLSIPSLKPTAHETFSACSIYSDPPPPFLLADKPHYTERIQLQNFAQTRP